MVKQNATQYFCLVARRQLLCFYQKKTEIIEFQAFVDNIYDLIKQIHKISWQNKYKKIFQLVKYKVNCI